MLEMDIEVKNCEEIWSLCVSVHGEQGESYKEHHLRCSWTVEERNSEITGNIHMVCRNDSLKGHCASE